MGVFIFKMKSIFDFVTKKKEMSEKETEEFIDGMMEEAVEQPDSESDAELFLMYKVPRSLMNMSLDMIDGKLK